MTSNKLQTASYTDFEKEKSVKDISIHEEVTTDIINIIKKIRPCLL